MMTINRVAGLFLCVVGPQSVVDGLPSAYKACQEQYAGAQCKIPGDLPGSDRRGSCIELLPSERGCSSNSVMSETEDLNGTLVCISCEASSSAFGRMDQWAIFACGAVMGSLFTTALCTVVLKWRKALEAAREKSRDNRDRRSVENRRDLNEVQVDGDRGPPGSRKKRQGSKDNPKSLGEKPKSPRRKKRAGEARSEEGAPSSIAPSSVGSSDDEQPRSKAKGKPKRAARPEGEAADSEDNDQDEAHKSSRSVPKPKESKAPGTQIKAQTKDAHVKQQGKGTPAVHQHHQLDEALEGVSAQIDSLPMSEVNGALNIAGGNASAMKAAKPVAPVAVAVPKTPDVVAHPNGKAAPKAKKDDAKKEAAKKDVAKKEEAKQEAKWDQMQADLDLAVCEEGGRTGMCAAPKL